MDNLVIRPLQNLLIDAFELIQSQSNQFESIFSKTLQPLEFIDLENVVTEEQREEETAI